MGISIIDLLRIIVAVVDKVNVVREGKGREEKERAVIVVRALTIGVFDKTVV